jgi:hypothetical protein
MEAALRLRETEMKISTSGHRAVMRHLAPSAAQPTPDAPEDPNPPFVMMVAMVPVWLGLFAAAVATKALTSVLDRAWPPRSAQ